jgi:hypothetical protein
MEILRAYNLINDKDNINIQGTIDEPLFDINYISKILEINNINDYDANEKKKYKNNIYLTENGLYRILLESTHKIANTFQKWMSNSIKEKRINGFYKLNENNEVDKILMEYNSDISNHKKIINLYDSKNIIYICTIKKYYDYKYIIKIGSTNDIKKKLLQIQDIYNISEPLLLYALEINNNKKIEKNLHENLIIKKHYMPYNINKDIISKKTYLFEEFHIFSILKNIINETIILFHKKIFEELSIQKEKLSIEKENIILKKKEIELEILNKSIELTSKQENTIDEISDTESETASETDIDNTLCNFKIKTRKNGIKIPKVYQYNPSDLSTPIKIFDSPADVEREYSFISPSSLRSAAKNNIIYKNYRWLFLLRNEEPPEKISDTVEIKHKSPEIKYIAMIDIKKTKIMDVFTNQKDAVNARNMKSRSFTRAIQEESISSGHYWKFFEDCSEEMKNEYLKNNVLPEKYKASSGKKVIQIDPKTNEQLKIYDSQREVIKLFQMSANTLKNISESGVIHNGYKWKIIAWNQVAPHTLQPILCIK